MTPNLFIKFDGEDEFNVADKMPSFKFLGEDNTPSVSNSMQENVGIDGSFFQFSKFANNQLTLKFILRFRDYYELKSLKHDIYALFLQKKKIRLRTDAERNICKYVYPTGFDIAPVEDFSKACIVSIVCDNPSGVSYSIYRSNQEQDIWDDYPLGWSLPAGYNDYEFSDNLFNVINFSDINVDPYSEKHDLKIIIKFKGDSITLKNSTNGSSYTYSKASTLDDTILLDGITTYRNGVADSINSDFGNLSLDKGTNSILVSGTTSFDITFSFPFIYV